MAETRLTGARIAVLLPCYNEEAAIAQTIAGFRAALPDAVIYVYDNNSSDGTRAVAAAAGAIVRTERMQGKGNVVRRMFADVEADIYVMADGDATYDASAAPTLIAKLLDDLLFDWKEDPHAGDRGEVWGWVSHGDLQRAVIGDTHTQCGPGRFVRRIIVGCRECGPFGAADDIEE